MRKVSSKGLQREGAGHGDGPWEKYMRQAHGQDCQKLVELLNAVSAERTLAAGDVEERYYCEM